MIFKEYIQHENFFLVAGPCAVEDEKTTLEIAHTLRRVTEIFHIPLIFKASYRKANRTSMGSFSGIGDRQALRILKKVKKEFGLPVLTDVHETGEIKKVAKVADVLQVPAFLCRQTALLLACAESGRAVNIKKGQFMSPESMRHAVAKVRPRCPDVMITERGTSFGYQDLVVDFRSIPMMKQFGVPVVMDITHCLQQPNQSAGQTLGNRDFAGVMGKAAVAVGVDGIFLETHPHPSRAKSDSATMVPLDRVGSLLRQFVDIRRAVRT